MLQKLSEFDVKAWICWYLLILPPFRFYVKSILGNFKRSKNVLFGNFRDCELGILVNLGLGSWSNLLKSKFRASKFAKNYIFELYEFTKIWFHAKSERRYNDQSSTKSSLNFISSKFLEHSVGQCPKHLKVPTLSWFPIANEKLCNWFNF